MLAVNLPTKDKCVPMTPITMHTSLITHLQTGMYYLHLTDGTTWLAGSAFVVE